MPTRAFVYTQVNKYSECTSGHTFSAFEKIKVTF